MPNYLIRLRNLGKTAKMSLMRFAEALEPSAFLLCTSLSPSHLSLHLGRCHSDQGDETTSLRDWCRSFSFVEVLHTPWSVFLWWTRFIKTTMFLNGVSRRLVFCRVHKRVCVVFARLRVSVVQVRWLLYPFLCASLGFVSN